MMITAQHPGTAGSSAKTTAAFHPYTTTSGWIRPPRSTQGTVLVAHSSPLVAAGLTAVLRQLEGCEVRVWDTMSEEPAAGSVVVGDDLAMAAQISARAGTGADPIRVPEPKVVLVTDGSKEAHRASVGFKAVSAWLSLDCPEQELLNAVQGLLEGAPLARRSPSATTDADPCPASNAAGLAQRARPTGGLAPGALRKVREHIEASFAQKVDLSRLARIAGLSTSYFSRAFKQSIGMPPHRYVLMRRLAAAAELISKTCKPLAEVAIDVGFSDQSHFTRIFTQMTGETPGALRRRYR